MWTRIWALIIKEFLSLWKDSRVRSVVLIPPLIQVIIFSYAATFDVTRVPIGIWDEDATPLSRELVARFSSSDAFSLDRRFEEPEGVARALTNQEVFGVLHIGPHFAADIAALRPPHVQLLLDGRRSNTALIVNAYAASIVGRFDADRLAAMGYGGGISIALRAWFNPNLDSKWFMLPSLVVMLPFIMTIIVTALSVARERELGTFDQLLVTPLRPIEIMIGKVAPALLIGLFEGHLLYAVARLWFGVPFVGDIPTLYAGMIIFLLSGIAIGLAISSVTQTQQQAILGVFMFLSPAVILSGMATPIENMPLWCQWITHGNPIRYMTTLSRGLFLRDIGWAVALGEIWPMAVIAVCGLTGATWLFRRRLA